MQEDAAPVSPGEVRRHAAAMALRFFSPVAGVTKTQAARTMPKMIKADRTALLLCPGLGRSATWQGVLIACASPQAQTWVRTSLCWQAAASGIPGSAGVGASNSARDSLECLDTCSMATPRHETLHAPMLLSRPFQALVFSSLLTTNIYHRSEHWHASLRALLLLVLEPKAACHLLVWTRSLSLFVGCSRALLRIYNRFDDYKACIMRLPHCTTHSHVRPWRNHLMSFPFYLSAFMYTMFPRSVDTQ